MQRPHSIFKKATFLIAYALLLKSFAFGFEPVISVDALLTHDSASSPGSAQIFLRADGYPTPASYRWTKDGRPLVKGDQDTYDTTQVSFGSAGWYQLTVEAEQTRATSKPVPVGVVKTGEQKMNPIAEGRNLTLKQTAAGPELRFQWFKDGIPLSDVTGKIIGAQTATLKLFGLLPEDGGLYHCLVSLRNLTLMGQSWHFDVTPKPVVTHIDGIDDWAVGRPVVASVQATNQPTRYEIKGLPPGVTFNPKNGQLGGSPRLPGTYHLSTRAFNVAGASAWFKESVTVAPFPAEATGTFAGLVGRTGGGDPGYGGAWKLIVTSNGAFTGTVDVGIVRYPFSGRLQNPVSGTPEAWIQLASGWLVMNVKIDTVQGRADGLVALNNFAFQLPLEAKKVLPLRPNVAPANWLGLHYVKLSPDASVIGNPAYPQSEAIGQIVVRHNGSYTWIGHLSDGAAYTMSGQVTPLGAFAARTLLYGKRGSIQGWQELLEPEGWVSGFLEWIKYHRPGDASFPNGFPLHSLNVREPGVAP